MAPGGQATGTTRRHRPRARSSPRRWRVRQGARCACNTATVVESMAIRRIRPVLVVRAEGRPGTSNTARRITSWPVSRSMSDHRRPHNSPRRQPVDAATKRSAESCVSWVSASSMSCLTSSGVAGQAGSGLNREPAGASPEQPGTSREGPSAPPGGARADDTAW